MEVFVVVWKLQKPPLMTQRTKNEGLWMKYQAVFTYVRLFNKFIQSSSTLKHHKQHERHKPHEPHKPHKDKKPHKHPNHHKQHERHKHYKQHKRHKCHKQHKHHKRYIQNSEEELEKFKENKGSCSCEQSIKRASTGECLCKS